MASSTDLPKQVFIKIDMANKTYQQNIDLIRATDQFRAVSFGKVRRFQAIGLRSKDGNWQVQDSNGKWYSLFWCEQ